MSLSPHQRPTARPDVIRSPGPQSSQEPGAGFGWYADRYFEVLPTGGHAQLPTAPGVVFTENGQVLQLGRGLWATATGAAASRAVTVADDDAGQVAAWGMVSEAGRDAILGVRLKVESGLITEIETFVVRINDMVSGSGFLDAGRLAQPTPGFLDLVGEPDRPTREELRRAADGYLDEASGGDADLIPVADDCLRIENGVQTVLLPAGRAVLPGREPNPVTQLGVAQQVRAGHTRHIAAARDRRLYLTDPARGLVLVSFFFDHPGKVRGWQGRAPFIAPNSMPAWEVFNHRRRCGAGPDILDPADRASREELTAAAHGYLDGVSRDDADLIPAADDCLRIENGLQTVLNADGAGFPAALRGNEGLRLAVRAQIRTRAFRYIEDIRDRRVVAADTERPAGRSGGSRRSERPSPTGCAPAGDRGRRRAY